MPHGFNEDKSMFDLSDIDQSTEGTFTVNPATSGNRITNANIMSWAEGRIGCVAGSFVPRYSYSSAFWLLVGTTDILPAAETGGTFASTDYGSSNLMKITTDGKLYMRLINDSNDNVAVSFSISYVVAE